MKTNGVIHTWNYNTQGTWVDGPVGSGGATGTPYGLSVNGGYTWSRPGDFNASRVSSVYVDGVSRVRPAGVGMPYIIKY